MPRVSGIIETALYAADLSRTAEFYRDVFGFPTLTSSDRLIALDVAGRSVLLLFQQDSTREAFAVPGGVIPPHGSGPHSHFAFAISPNDVDAWKEYLRSKQIAVESTVTWPGGAESIYFRDPDENLVELLTPGFWAIY